MGNKIRIGIFGSCSTREVFTTYYNDYKNHFELIFSHERESVISLFQNPIDLDFNELKLLPDSKKNQFRTNNMINDLSKSFFNDLKKGIDYLIIDVYFEALFGILILEDGNIITNNKWDLPKTEFYSKLNNFKIFTMSDDSKKYFDLWKKYCDNFFKLLNDSYPDVKIILNKIKLADKVFKEDYSFYVNPQFRDMVNTLSPFIDMFEKYIEKNYDVITIDYDGLLYTSELNRWSPYVVHLMPDYYKYVYFMLCKITGVEKSHLLSANLQYALEKLDICEKITDNSVDIIENQNDLILNLEESLKEKDKIITRNNVELKNLRTFKNDVLNSSSWKITKPLRNSKHIFQKSKD